MKELELRALAPVPAATAIATHDWTVPDGLSFDADPSQILRTLLDMGFTPAQLQSERVLDCSDASLRNWLEGGTTPREKTAVVLDDLRTVVVALDAAGIRSMRAVQWLFKRNMASRWIAGRRPIELLIPRPLLLLAAVQDLLYLDESGRPETVHLHIQPPEAEEPAVPEPAARPRRQKGKRLAAAERV